MLVVETRRIIRLRKPNGSKQYFLTLPKRFAENLINKGVNELLIISNNTLAAFPNEANVEQRIMAFLAKHHELAEQIFKGEQH